MIWRGVCFDNLLKSFGSNLFQKGLSEPPRSAVAIRRWRNPLALKSATEGVNVKPWLDRGGTAQEGGSPYPTMLLLTSIPLFSLTEQAYEVVIALKSTYAVPKYSFGNISFTPIKPTGAKKKAWQKRNARKGVSPSADGDQRTRVGSAVAF